MRGERMMDGSTRKGRSKPRGGRGLGWSTFRPRSQYEREDHPPSDLTTRAEDVGTGDEDNLDRPWGRRK